MSKIVAIIQARLGSSRLPRKVLLPLAGKTVLQCVIERVRRSRLINEVIVATTIAKEDLEVVKLCADLSVRVFCGSCDDVLDRYYQAARLIRPEHIVRITSDCPLIDPLVIDSIIQEHLLHSGDYTSNTIKETYPDGQDAEVFTLEALKKTWQNAKLSSEREHVTPYMRKYPNIFKLYNVEYKEDLSQKRWTIDNPEDYDFITAIYNGLNNQGFIFTMHDILLFLKDNPGIEKINHHIMRNEGYQKSLRDDRILDLS